MKTKIAIISILANILLAGLKIIGAALTGSASILAEGLHSSMDVFSSFIGLLGIKIAKKPADKEHPYGHFKFEVLAGLLITLILFLTGLWIVFQGYKRSLNPSLIRMSYLGLIIMFFSAILNELVARLKIHYGKKENSIALLSDGVHSQMDVWASLIVLGNLILTKYWILADSFLSILIGLYIIRHSFSLGKEAIDSLLDVSAPLEIENKIRSIAQLQGINISTLKTQRRGAAITADLEISLPKDLSVKEATKISEELRKKLMREIKNLSFVAIQIKSHDTETDFYRPNFGRGFGWQGQGRFQGQVVGAAGQGPGGYCVCPNCGYKIPHQRGVPCSTLKCPQCNIPLERKIELSDE